MANARSVALRILLKIEQEQAYSNLALANAIRENRLSAVDASFVSALVYGVLERQITLDEIIRQYSKIPLRKIELKTKIILRMGILQLLFMDKVPDSAAVNESVNLAKKNRLQHSAGFINGILRGITRAEVKYRLPDETDKIAYFSIRYSAPRELVKLWLDAYGESNTEQLLLHLSGRPPICARVNTLRTDADSLIARLAEEGVQAEKISFLSDALTLSHTGDLEKLKAFRAGLFHVQDASSQLCVSALNPQPRDVLLDVCAAPGGKAFTAAERMQNRGKVLAFDLYEHKVRLMQSGAKRLGLDIVQASVRDAVVGLPLPQADRILCDVPCSGLGILSRKPEIRYKKGLTETELPDTQYAILCRSASYLAVGGRLVYATCTLNPRENHDVTARFLREHPEFEGVTLQLPDGVTHAIDEQDWEIILMPHTAHTDGFYFAAFTRRSL
ncbi:MAG: 16S rRNA (cytosine(967)-C(5))-methyltransferase RsmB [Ruminococcus sp.]|nr:16S rRNA (cytosine(967)-C(5))-methyltransferase RsmB [Ruminococcus sp.]